MIKKVWNIVNTILIIIVAILVFLIVGTRFIGFSPYIVLSGSMEPTYMTGSVLYVKEIEVGELKERDVITYRLSDDETIATHRIIEVLEEDGETVYRTKGDANDVEDNYLVPGNHIIGSPKFSVPYLGYLISYIQSESGRYAMIATGAAVLLSIFLPDFIFCDDEEGKEKDE